MKKKFSRNVHVKITVETKHGKSTHVGPRGTRPGQGEKSARRQSWAATFLEFRARPLCGTRDHVMSRCRLLQKNALGFSEKEKEKWPHHSIPSTRAVTSRGVPSISECKIDRAGLLLPLTKSHLAYIILLYSHIDQNSPLISATLNVCKWARVCKHQLVSTLCFDKRNMHCSEGNEGLNHMNI